MVDYGLSSSVSEIARLGQLVNQSVGHLRENGDGARSRFQKFESGLRTRTKAAEDCNAIATNAASSSQLLLDADRALLKSREGYQKRLGPGAKVGFRHAVIPKLKYGFSGDKKATQHVQDTQPYVDAATLQVLKALDDKIRQASNQQNDIHQLLSTSINPRLNLTSTSQDLAALDARLDARDALFWTRFKAASANTRPSQAQNTTIYQPTSAAAQTAPNFHTLVQSTAPENLRAAVYAVIGLIAATIYRRGDSAKAACTTLARDGPNHTGLMTLLVCCITALTTSIVILPQRLSLLNDESVLLETALGEQIRIASCVWRAGTSSNFHRFLLDYFKDRVGADLVRVRRYNILVGGVDGLTIEESKWLEVVSACKKLTMAMILDFEQIDTCLRCGSELWQRRDNKYECVKCDRTYHSTTSKGFGDPLQLAFLLGLRAGPRVSSERWAHRRFRTANASERGLNSRSATSGYTASSYWVGGSNYGSRKAFVNVLLAQNRLNVVQITKLSPSQRLHRNWGQTSSSESSLPQSRRHHPDWRRGARRRPQAGEK
jgi:hypothetical protein